MLIKNARLSFPSIFDPSAMDEGDTPKYRATLILPEDDPQVQEIHAEIKRIVGQRWPNKKPSGIKVCLRDGAEKEMDGFGPGTVFFNASNTVRPPVFDRDRSPLTREDGKPYAGCYVNAKIDFWVQDNNFGKRVNASLQGLQFVKDGEAFGGGRPAEADDFEDLSNVLKDPAETADWLD
jgi:hypothetical protein